MHCRVCGALMLRERQEIGRSSVQDWYVCPGCRREQLLSAPARTVPPPWTAVNDGLHHWVAAPPTPVSPRRP